jgi:hypothetical protein
MGFTYHLNPFFKRDGGLSGGRIVLLIEAARRRGKESAEFVSEGAGPGVTVI